jgi:V8-like Glu-specific endopeptidase
VWNPKSKKYEQTKTMEHVLFPSGNNTIAEPGDSGSLVYDAETGRVVGLHIAGAKGTGHVYFTSIHDVYRDIMEVTGAINVRMA